MGRFNNNITLDKLKVFITLHRKSQKYKILTWLILMGQRQSMSEPAPRTGNVEQFDCHVSTGGCSGINFRPNPFTRSGGSGMRQVDNGDFLEGVIYDKDGKDYLKVSKIKRGGKSR